TPLTTRTKFIAHAHAALLDALEAIIATDPQIVDLCLSEHLQQKIAGTLEKWIQNLRHGPRSKRPVGHSIEESFVRTHKRKNMNCTGAVIDFISDLPNHALINVQPPGGNLGHDRPGVSGIDQDKPSYRFSDPHHIAVIVTSSALLVIHHDHFRSATHFLHPTLLFSGKVAAAKLLRRLQKVWRDNFVIFNLDHQRILLSRFMLGATRRLPRQSATNGEPA